MRERERGRRRRGGRSSSSSKGWRETGREGDRGRESKKTVNSNDFKPKCTRSPYTLPAASYKDTRHASLLTRSISPSGNDPAQKAAGGGGDHGGGGGGGHVQPPQLVSPEALVL